MFRHPLIIAPDDAFPPAISSSYATGSQVLVKMYFLGSRLFYFCSRILWACGKTPPFGFFLLGPGRSFYNTIFFQGVFKIIFLVARKFYISYNAVLCFSFYEGLLSKYWHLFFTSPKISFYKKRLFLPNFEFY